MSWHCVGVKPLPEHPGHSAAIILSTVAWTDWRNVALSAAVAAPVPPRAFTIAVEQRLDELVGQDRFITEDHRGELALGALGSGGFLIGGCFAV